MPLEKTKTGSPSAINRAPDIPSPALGSPRLQDQTVLLPFKQLLVVFMGLSCALFCKTLHNLCLGPCLIGYVCRLHARSNNVSLHPILRGKMLNVITSLRVPTILPSIEEDIGGSSITSWIGTAYLLASTSCQPIYGRLSDIFGRKVVLSGSMMVFVIGSTLCAVSRSITMLIAFRGSTMHMR